MANLRPCTFTIDGKKLSYHEFLDFADKNRQLWEGKGVEVESTIGIKLKNGEPISVYAYSGGKGDGWFTTNKAEAIEYSFGREGDRQLNEGKITIKSPFVVDSVKEFDKVVKDKENLVKNGYDGVAYNTGFAIHIIPFTEQKISSRNKIEIEEMYENTPQIYYPSLLEQKEKTKQEPKQPPKPDTIKTPKVRNYSHLNNKIREEAALTKEEFEEELPSYLSQTAGLPPITPKLSNKKANEIFQELLTRPESELLDSESPIAKKMATWVVTKQKEFGIEPITAEQRKVELQQKITTSAIESEALTAQEEAIIDSEKEAKETRQEYLQRAFKDFVNNAYNGKLKPLFERIQKKIKVALSVLAIAGTTIHMAAQKVNFEDYVDMAENYSERHFFPSKQKTFTTVAFQKQEPKTISDFTGQEKTPYKGGYVTNQVINLDSNTFEVRERNDDTPVENAVGITGNVFKPFVEFKNFKQTLNQPTEKRQNPPVIAFNKKTGKIKVGNLFDFKDGNWMVSEANTIPLNFKLDSSGKIEAAKHREAERYVPLSTGEDGQKYKFPIGLDTKESKIDPTKHNSFGTLEGGKVIMSVGDYQIQVNGGFADIYAAWKELKDKYPNKPITGYLLDNGSYNLPILKEDGIVSLKDLKDSRNRNRDGGTMLIQKKKTEVPVQSELKITNESTPNYMRDSSGKKIENKPEFIVLHHTGWYNNEREVVDQFKTKGGNSAHYLINLDGSITKFNDESYGLHHAGKSSFNGKEGLNDKSIGIEVYGDSQTNDFTEKQYESLIKLLGIISGKYDIPIENIVDHETIRKQYKEDHPHEKGVHDKNDLSEAVFNNIVDKLKTEIKATKKDSPLKGSALDNHIAAVEDLKKKIKNKTYSDPLLLSATSQLLLDAYISILKAARAAGRAITRGQAMYQAQQQINKDKKYDSKQMAEAAKAVFEYEKGTVKRDIEKTVGIRKTKKEVQRIIDKAYAIGVGTGEKEGFEKGSKEGLKEGKMSAARTMRTLLLGLKADLNPRQINALLERFAKQRDFSPEGKQAFQDFADKIIEDANYVLFERAANTLKGRVKKLSRSERTPANDKSLFRAFAGLSINHMDAETLQKYIAWGNQIVGKTLKNRADLRQFILDQREIQSQITQERSEKMLEGRERNLKEEFENLQKEGKLPEGVTTLDQYRDSKKPAPKEKADVKKMLSDLVIPEDTDSDTKKVLETLKKEDLSLLSAEDLVLLENAISNFADTGELYAAGDIAAKAKVYNAIAGLPKFIRNVNPKDARRLSLTNIFLKFFDVSASAAKVRSVLIQPWLSKASKVYERYEVVSGDIQREMQKLGIKADNVNRIDLYGFLNEKGGDSFEQLRDQKLSDLKKLKEMVDEGAKSRDKNEDETGKSNISRYEALKSAVESLGLTENSTLEEVESKLTDNEKKMYDEFRKRLDRWSGMALKNMALYGNKEIIPVENYWPRNAHRTNAKEAGVPVGNLEDFAMYSNGSNVGHNIFQRQKGRVGLIGENGYYEPIGLMNFFNGLRETMFMAEAADEYHQMQAVFNSPKGIDKLMKGEGVSLLKQFLVDMVKDTKNMGRYDVDTRTNMAKFFQHIKDAATGSLIKSPTQYLKQSTALAVPLIMAPKETAVALKVMMQYLKSADGTPMDHAMQNFGSESTLGIRIALPEHIETQKYFASDRSELEKVFSLLTGTLNKYLGGEAVTQTDKFVSRLSTLAGYIQYQVQTGKLKKASDFDLLKEEANGWDMEAMAAGEQMQGRTNNENARILFSQRQKDSGAMYFLTNFTHQAVMGVYINARKLRNPYSTPAEKTEATKALFAYVLSIAAFYGAGQLSKYILSSLFDKIKSGFSDDDEEEKERKRKMLEDYNKAKALGEREGAIAKEVMNLAGGTQNILIQAAINIAAAGSFEAAQRMLKDEEDLPEFVKERMTREYDPFFGSEAVGQPGIVGQMLVKPLGATAKADDKWERGLQEAEIMALKLTNLSAPAYFLNSIYANERRAVMAKKYVEGKENKELAEDFSPGTAEQRKARTMVLNYLEIGDVEKARKELAKAGEPYAVAKRIMDDKAGKGIPNQGWYNILRVAQGKDKDATLYLGDGTETTVRKFFADKPDGLANILNKYKAQEARQKKQLQLLNKIKPKDDNTDYTEFFFSKLNE